MCNFINMSRWNISIEWMGDRSRDIIFDCLVIIGRRFKSSDFIGPGLPFVGLSCWSLYKGGSSPCNSVRIELPWLCDSFSAYLAHLPALLVIVTSLVQPPSYAGYCDLIGPTSQLCRLLWPHWSYLPTLLVLVTSLVQPLSSAGYSASLARGRKLLIVLTF